MNSNPELDEFIKGDADWIVLRVLAHSPLHGYGVSRAIEKYSEGKLHLGEATVYPTLRALERKGLVKSNWEIPDSGPHRKVYTITPQGRTVMEKKRSAFSDYSNALSSFVGGKLGEAGA